jgi:hypothetical protein
MMEKSISSKYAQILSSLKALIFKTFIENLF